MLTFHDLIQVSAATGVLAPKRGVGTRGFPGQHSVVRVGEACGEMGVETKILLYDVCCFLPFM